MELRTFDRERLAVGCLIGATAVLCVVGAMAQFLDLPTTADRLVQWVLVMAFAALCGFSLWVANVAAACAQILADHRKSKRWAFAIALVTAGVTGLVSVIGVDLSYLYLIGEQQAYPETASVIAAGFALAFVKVAMGFVIQACEQVESAEGRAHDALLEARDKRIRELEAELRAALSQAKNLSPANDVEASQSTPRRAPAAASRTAARALRDAPMEHAAKAPQEQRQNTDRAPPLSEEEVAALLAKMADAGIKGEVISLNAVRKFAGVPYSRIERSPGRHLIEAARAAA